MLIYCIDVSWNMIYFFDLQTKAIISGLLSSVLDLNMFSVLFAQFFFSGKHTNDDC